MKIALNFFVIELSLSKHSPSFVGEGEPKEPPI